MTKNRAYNTATYCFQAGEKILVDTNIWLYLQPPAAQPPPGYSSRYSAALKKLITARAQPVVDVLILSEYLNRYLRLEYNIFWSGRYPKFKDFRSSVDFATVSLDAVADARQILKYTAMEDTVLSNADLAIVLKETETGSMDFNDGVLIENCRARGWKLLTDDSDMQLGGIDVLTTNPKLLSACP